MPRKRKETTDRWNYPFPSRLRELLNEKEISHQALASFLGVARQSVGAYCDGSASPSFENLTKIAEYFGVTSDYLLGLSDVSSTENSVQIACETTGLSEKSIKRIQKITSAKPIHCGLSDEITLSHALNTFLESEDIPDFICDISLAQLGAKKATENYLRIAAEKEINSIPVEDVATTVTILQKIGSISLPYHEAAGYYIKAAVDDVERILYEEIMKPLLPIIDQYIGTDAMQKNVDIYTGTEDLLQHKS